MRREQAVLLVSIVLGDGVCWPRRRLRPRVPGRKLRRPPVLNAPLGSSEQTGFKEDRGALKAGSLWQEGKRARSSGGQAPRLTNASGLIVGGAGEVEGEVGVESGV